MFTVSEPYKYVAEIKKSRFIATAAPIDSVGQALEKIELFRDPDATHNCWAYRIGEEYRFSDDGEPGGTAGRPILGAINAQEVDRVLVVVTRFFGGIKLGAGGLARAYGKAAAKCLSEASKREIEPKINIAVEIPFDSIGAVYQLIEEFDAQKTEEAFAEGGVTLTVEIKNKHLDDFSLSLRNATKGRAGIHPTHEEKTS
jgi:uncharacterized YigZ family protein